MIDRDEVQHGQRHFLTAFALAALWIAPSGALAGQPISSSLAECSVIFNEVAHIGKRRGKPEDEVNAALLSAGMFVEAAFEEAKREGRADAYDHVQANLVQAAEKWDGRLSDITLIKDNKDWIDYCRALGESRGVTLP